MAMCHLLNEENGLFPMDEDRVRGVLRLAFNRRGGVLGLIGEPGHAEAMIFMLISQMWCSSQWHLEELFNYCRPEFRKSNNAKALMNFAKRCAVELDMPLVIGVITNTRTKEKVRLYERQFSHPHGAFFLYNTKWDRPTTEVSANGPA